MQRDDCHATEKCNKKINQNHFFNLTFIGMCSIERVKSISPPVLKWSPFGHVVVKNSQTKDDPAGLYLISTLGMCIEMWKYYDNPPLIFCRRTGSGFIYRCTYTAVWIGIRGQSIWHFTMVTTTLTWCCTIG